MVCPLRKVQECYASVKNIVVSTYLGALDFLLHDYVMKKFREIEGSVTESETRHASQES